MSETAWDQFYMTDAARDAVEALNRELPEGHVIGARAMDRPPAKPSGAHLRFYASTEHDERGESYGFVSVLANGELAS